MEGFKLYAAGNSLITFNFQPNYPAAMLYTASLESGVQLSGLSNHAMYR
jgi:hypothetical protein